MSIWWEALPLATLAGTTVFCAWRWRWHKVRYDSCNEQRREWHDKCHAERLSSVGLKIANTQLEERVRLERERAIDLEDRLRAIERQRSETTRKGNLTRAAKRKALVDAKTNELREQLQASIAAEDFVRRAA